MPYENMENKGALMLSIDCNHPDLEEFINIKSDLNKVTKANISIKLTNDFMNAVLDNKNFDLSFTRIETGEKIIKTVNAKEMFKKIATMNWQMAEPGALFWDNIKDWNLLSDDPDFEYAGVNPCAEEPLPGGGSCLLGSINLSEFIIDPFKKDCACFDEYSFLETVRESVIFLNEILDEGLPLHPLQEQKDSVNDWRQIGLGIMGLADALIKLGIKYGSKESIDFCDNIGFLMINEAIKESALLASKYGAYPKYNKNAVLESKFLKDNTSLITLQSVKNHGLRNSQLLTCAPTGTLSTMLGISGGIEPIFNISYTRKTESLHGKEEYYKIYTPIVKEYMELNNINDEKDLPDYFVTAMTLNYKERIHMQAIWQRHIDASISSTVNVPENFTIEDTENLYMYAWTNKLKGITIFRDNCFRTGILTNDSKDKEDEYEDEENKMSKLPWGTTLQSTDDLIGRKRKLITGCGSLHLQAWYDSYTGRLMEIYLNKGSLGGCNSFMNGLSRILSGALRTGMGFDYMIDQLKSCPSCPSYAVRTSKQKNTSKGNCCPSSIANALIEIQKEIDYEINPDDEEYSNTTVNVEIKNNGCPECGEELQNIGGCITCISCAWSKCG